MHHWRVHCPLFLIRHQLLPPLFGVNHLLRHSGALYQAVTICVIFLFMLVLVVPDDKDDGCFLPGEVE